MKVQLLKILLYLCCSITLGIGSGAHIFTDGYDYSNTFCESNAGFEDDICFDILVHSMQLDLVENDFSFDLSLTESPIEWQTIAVAPASSGAAINLPLRAPPLVG